ncbi:MAG: peptidylprolyl isomerase [Armatimonadota bacterium]|jgi:tetratricopeptide (TPR) repeat protein
MGIIAIRKKMGRGLKYLFGAFLIIFAAGIFVSFGPGGGGGRRGPWQSGPGSVPEGPAVMARLDDHKITRTSFYSAYLESRRGRTIRVLGDMRDLKLTLLDQMVHNILIAGAMSAEDIEVTEQDINAAVARDVESAIRQQFPSGTSPGQYSKRRLADYLKGAGITIEEFRARKARELAGTRDYEQSVGFQKLQQSIYGDIKLSDDDVKAKYRERRVQWIVVRPPGSPLSASPTGDEPPTALTAAEDKEAKRRAGTILKRLRDGADFGQVAVEESADPGSAADDGYVGYHQRERFDQELVGTHLAQQPYARSQRVSLAVYRAARALEEPIFDSKLGEISEPIRTDWGYVIVRPSESKENAPDDFDENKERYKTMVEGWARRARWDRYYYGKLWENATLEVEDPELQAYVALEKGERQTAYRLLTEALEQSNIGHADGPGDAVQNFEFARVAEMLGKTDEAVQHYEAAAQTAGAAHDVHMALGRLYKDAGKKAFALRHFQAASDAGDTKFRENVEMHRELAQLYEQMGKTLLSQEQEEWVQDFYVEERLRWERLRAGS